MSRDKPTSPTKPADTGQRGYQPKPSGNTGGVWNGYQPSTSQVSPSKPPNEGSSGKK